MQAISVQAVGRVEKRTLARVAALVLLLWACDAIAAPAPRDPQPPAEATVVAGDFRPALSVGAATLPSFDIEGGTHASRVDVTVMPNAGSTVGLSLGITAPAAPAAGFAPPAPAAQSLNLGLRWHYTMDSGQRFDVTAYRRLPERDALSMVESRDPSYGARFEMALGSGQLPKKGFVAQHGFVGLQLESGARLTIKRSGGVPMLYYRNTF